MFTLALALLATAYLGLGFYTLVFDTSFSFPVDLRLRWIEMGMIREGINPQEHTYPLELLPENVSAQQYVKGNYPPWSYATGLLLAPPISWQAARVSFACVNFVAIAGIGYWAYRQGAAFGAEWGAAAVASVLAGFPFCVCLSYGQYSIFVLAMIVACLEFLRRQRMFAAGFALGLAAVKPQLAGLFCLVPLIFPSFSWSQRLRFLVGGGLYAVASSTLIAWCVGSTPWEMLSGPANESIKFYHLSSNPLVIWAASLLGFSVGSKLLAIVVAACCAAALFRIRHQDDLLAGFSVCAILAMYWSYSRHYDLVMYAIPLMYLLRSAVAVQLHVAAMSFLLLGFLLWSPIRIDLSRSPMIQALLAVACIAAIVAFMSSNSRANSTLRRAHAAT